MYVYVLKVAGTQSPPEILRMEVIHQLDETRLGLLFAHGFALDGLDFGYCFRAVF